MNNNIPPITKNLLIINVLCFFGAIVAERYGIDVDKILSLHFFMASDFNMGQLVTYMFMHGGFTHIFFNMFALWMFGRVLEQVWGPKRFLIYYMVCGIGAGLIQEIVQFVEYETVLSNYDSVQTGFGIIPMEEYLNMMRTVGAKAKFFVIFYAVVELFLGMSANDNVAHFAHLGGMLFGFILILYWRKKNGNGQTIY